MAIKFSDGTHWYTKEGDPKHDADLRIARKELLYPSPTSLDKAMFVNDFLGRWKMNELALAASDNPRQPHEDEEAYVNRIYELSLDKARIAAEFGKSIHDAIEHYPQLPILPDLMDWVLEFEKWWRANNIIPISRETVLVDHDIAVAGRTDIICLYNGERAIVDYKSQGVKADAKGRKKPNFYESWPRQLSFYAVADAKKCNMFPAIPKCISLVIDSNPAGTVYEKVWSREEIYSSYEDFVLAAWRWQKQKKYWPGVHGKFNLSIDVPMPKAPEVVAQA